MAAGLFKAPTANFTSTTLNGSITDSATTITVNDASGMQFPGYIVIDREDGNGTATPNSREVIKYTGISSNDLTGCTRGADNSTARAHSDGALVETMPTVGMWNDQYDMLTAEHGTDGTHGAITASSITLASGGTPTEFSTDGTMAGNSDTAVPTEKAVKTYVDANGFSGALQDMDNAGGSSTTSSTFANITGADVSVTLTATSHVMLVASVQAYANPGAITGNKDYEIQFHNGTSAVGSALGISFQPGNPRENVTIIAIDPSASGTKTYTVQHRSTDNSLSCTAEAINVSALAIPA